MRSYFRTLFRRRPSQRAQPAHQSRAHSPKFRNMASFVPAATLYACTMTSPTALGPVPEDADVKAHHLKNGRGFTNPWESSSEKSALQRMRSFIWRGLTGGLKFPDTSPPTVTVIEPTFLPSRNASQALRATWLGHACYYVEFPSGLRVLFDPVFEEHCSPSSFMGPKRYTKVPCHIKDLPVVDVVIISHSHYDHLSHPTVLELKESHPNAQFFVGLGLKKWFHECGITNVVELDWWQDVDIKLSPVGDTEVSTTSFKQCSPPEAAGLSTKSEITARISCLPCQHTSARSPFDKGATLWCSWAVSSSSSFKPESRSVWFAGDTGYRAVPDVPAGVDDYGEEYKDLPHCPEFGQIGDLRGPFDLGLIPIGAYEPRGLFSSVHANPFDSVNIFVDTKCQKALAMHWGTWALTIEPVLEPPILLRQALKRKGLPETGVFDICDIGETREF